MNYSNRTYTHTVVAHDGRTAHDDVVEDSHTSPVSLEHDGLLQTCSLSLSAVIPPVNGEDNDNAYIRSL